MLYTVARPHVAFAQVFKTKVAHGERSTTAVLWRLVEDHLLICSAIIVFYFQSRCSIGSNRKLQLISGKERRLITSLLMPDANARGGRAGDAGRHCGRCGPQIGSNVCNHINCACLGIDSKGMLADGNRQRGCARPTAVLPQQGRRADGVAGSWNMDNSSVGFRRNRKDWRRVWCGEIRGGKRVTALLEWNLQSHSLKPLMELVSLMGFWEVNQATVG